MLDDLRQPIETALAAACNFGDGCPAHLSAAMRYALLAPGKRLRPMLVLIAAEACLDHSNHRSIVEQPESLSQVMPGAVAVEMIHAYSLIHDDLPAMDDDDLRRGRPTVHIEFDEATAILAGDALQAEAFRHLIENIENPSTAVTAVGILASAAGAGQLVGGQADDLKAENGHDAGPLQTVDWLESIHRRKTGALFSASLDLGAVLMGADQDQRSALAAYAGHLGLAFQVVDDYLDFTADAGMLGKRTGKDADRGKLTYPGLLGAEEAKNKAVALIESAKQEALFFGPRSQRLLWLADYVLERTH
jgi:geranylgeranyl diphosphate synthase type II